MVAPSHQDPWAQVSEVVRLIHSGEARTRPELAENTRLGRNIITQRIQSALDLGLIRPSGEQRSRGGRGAEVYEFSGDQGRILAATIGTAELRVALTDLDLQIIESRRIEWDLMVSPQATCERVATEMEDLLRAHPEHAAWGVGIGVPTPVQPVTGRTIGPLIAGPHALEWATKLDIRTWFTQRMNSPVWTESISNLATLGAAAEPDSPSDLLYVRMGRGVSAGIISGGRLHRGADALAGEITHLTVDPSSTQICLCGRIGCLDTFASQWAVEAAAGRLLMSGDGGALESRAVTVADVVAAAEAGDPGCVDLILRAADATGRALASAVTWFNPRRVVVGGNALAMSHLFTGALTRTLNAQAPAGALQNLDLTQGSAERTEELRGAAALVTETLLSPSYLMEWGPGGFPIDVTKILDRYPLLV
ncbi:ROK family protein [Tessaracoccus lacteus]|uniref:ROK family protein n=1 Tax=Tessaracoccus lacteus TaxID=3041766 RepID=A0ABY8PX55_9ACTN|nr:ROK family protein [Tessaracoccus sp. T21]WGT47061.1 ROK family protein [Tessaracoccus sp. T21]